MAAVMRHHAPMELGIYTFGEVTEDARHGGTISVEQRLHDLLEEIELADEVGLDAGPRSTSRRRSSPGRWSTVGSRDVAGDEVAAEAGKAVGVAVQRAGRLCSLQRWGAIGPQAGRWSRSAAILEDQLKLPARDLPSDQWRRTVHDRGRGARSSHRHRHLPPQAKRPSRGARISPGSRPGSGEACDRPPVSPRRYLVPQPQQ